jgi:hypothetical protein
MNAAEPTAGASNHLDVAESKRELAWQRVPGAPADARGFSAEVLAGVARIWKEQRRVLLASFGGSSMEPTILAGEEVELICGEQCAVGDVIAFIYLDQVAVHRVIGAGRGGWLLTCGDAHTVPDIPITDPASIIGRVVSARRDGVTSPLAPAPVRQARRAVFLAFRLLMPFGPGVARRAVLIARALRSIRHGQLPATVSVVRVSIKESP